MTDDELKGRLAALELVAAIGLHGYGRSFAASGWPNIIREKSEAAKSALAPGLPSDAARFAAGEALDRMFNRSAKGF